MELIGSRLKPTKQASLATQNGTTKKITWSIWQNINGEWYALQTRATDMKSFNYDIALN